MARLEVLKKQKSLDWDPLAPKTGLAKCLLDEVKYILSEDFGVDASNLRLYCAIGTSLDFHHGTDGFFELKGSIATFDLTANPLKQLKEGKARVIIRRPVQGRPWKFIFPPFVLKKIAKILIKGEDCIFTVG